jgi:hypothetical protein
MQVYFTTVKRGAPLKEAGELIRLDWERKAVISRVPIFPANPVFNDPNPRGGGRGGRGIAFVDGKLIAASYHTLHVFDPALGHLSDISHSQFVGLHEISPSGLDCVWVTSTILDLALKLNVKSGEVEREYWARDLPGLQKALKVSSMGVDKTVDNRIRYLDPKILTNPSHLHLSAVAEWRGEVYALLGVRRAIVNLDRQTVVMADPDLKLGHNLRVLPEGIAIVLDSIGRTVRFYDLGRGKLVRQIDLMKIKWVRDLLRWPDRIYQGNRLMKETALRRGKSARPFCLRGMDLLERKLFIGASPATILCLDLDSGEIVDTYIYSKDVLLVIHGIKVIDD